MAEFALMQDDGNLVRLEGEDEVWPHPRYGDRGGQSRRRQRRRETDDNRRGADRSRKSGSAKQENAGKQQDEWRSWTRSGGDASAKRTPGTACKAGSRRCRRRRPCGPAVHESRTVPARGAVILTKSAPVGAELSRITLSASGRQPEMWRTGSPRGTMTGWETIRYCPLTSHRRLDRADGLSWGATWRPSSPPASRQLRRLSCAARFLLLRRPLFLLLGAFADCRPSLLFAAFSDLPAPVRNFREGSGQDLSRPSRRVPPYKISIVLHQRETRAHRFR